MYSEQRVQEAYEWVLREGSVKVYRARIVLIGQARAGKTSLKKTLLGLPFDPKEQSTEGIEVDPSNCEIEVNQVKNWHSADEYKSGLLEYSKDIARMVAEKLVDSTSENTPDKPEMPNAMSPPDFITKHVHQWLKYGSGITKEESVVSIDLWDFAGQHLYYASHPVFLSSRSVFILVHNLSKHLNAPAQPCVRQGTHDVLLENPYHETNVENLQSWLATIHSVKPLNEETDDNAQRILPYLPPPVIIVGTHADKPVEDIAVIKSQIQQRISGKEYEKHVIRPIFSIDNTKRSSSLQRIKTFFRQNPQGREHQSDIDGIQALRDKIMDVLHCEPYMGEEIPIRWFLFEKMIAALVAKQIYYKNVQQLQSYAKTECFVEGAEEFASMITFYHDIGMIIKHRNTVVLKAQWLIDLFKQLITIPPFDKVDHVHAKYWQELERYGILSMEFVDHVFSRFIQQGIIKEDILDMMDQFGLIAKFSPSPADVKYFVPALLKASPESICKMEPSPTDPCPLYLHFLDGFVPHGLFPQLVARSIRWCGETWPMEHPPTLYQNRARFVIGKQIHDLVLICKMKFIKIVLRKRTQREVSRDESAELATLVREFVEGTLQDLSQELTYLSGMQYELCVACPYCHQDTEEVGQVCSWHGTISCTHEACFHLLKIKQDQLLLCIWNPVDKVRTVCGLEKWLLKRTMQRANDERDGRHLSSEEVPPEILARGDLALEAYKKALAEGMTCVKRVPIMLIGQDRSGKTSLKKSLRGKRFNPDEDCTVGIDVDPSHFKVSTEIWKAGEKNEVTDSDTAMSSEHHTARLVVEKLREEKSVPEEKVMESRNNPLVDAVSSSVSSDLESSEMPRDPESIQTEPNHKHVPNADDKSDLTQWDTPLVKPKMPEEIAILIEKLLKEGDKLEVEDNIYSVLWDFGGQSVYYATHPLFLTARAMYLLVHDLSRDPQERAKPVAKQGMYEIFEDSFSPKNHLDYLDFWMTSVSSLASQNRNQQVSGVLPEKLPPVFLVCTHADKTYGGGNPSKLARKVFGYLQNKAYKTHLYDDVFAVDNTKSGLESECPGVTHLREKVLAVAKELPQMKEAIPIKWLKYEKALQVTREKSHTCITLKEAKKIASKACGIVEDKQFQTLLNFLHDQRILIHFDDTPELSKLVVLDPQWLIDVFKKVITIKPYCIEEKEFKELWKKLEETGLLDEKLLEHAWSPLFEHRETLERFEQRETSESLIAIMEKFSLLCPWPSSDGSCSKQYLVPSMLTSHPPEDIIKLVASAQIPSLFIKFESGHVLPGLFPRLVLQFFQLGKEFWSPLNPAKLYHHFVRFYRSGDEDCSVILLCHSSSIEIVVHRKNLSQSNMSLSTDSTHATFDVTCARAVCSKVGSMLECMRQEFCWLKNMRYDLSVICPVCCQGCAVSYCPRHHTQDCKQEKCLHFLLESELCGVEHVIRCRRSATAQNNKVQVKQFAPWFATLHVGEQPAIDERDGRHLSSENVCSSEVPDKIQRPNQDTQATFPAEVPHTGKVMKQGTPSDYDLEKLSNSIAKLWITLGRRLEIDDAKLDEIDDRRSVFSEKAYRMLKCWKQGNGSTATYRVLSEALCHEFVNRKDLAEQICLH